MSTCIAGLFYSVVVIDVDVVVLSLACSTPSCVIFSCSVSIETLKLIINSTSTSRILISLTGTPQFSASLKRKDVG